jgi:hypothetical protein
MRFPEARLVAKVGFKTHCNKFAIKEFIMTQKSTQNSAKKKDKKKPDMDIGAMAKLARVRQFKNLLEKIKNGRATAADMKAFRDLERDLSTEDEDQPSAPVPAKLTGPEAQEYLGISRRMLSYHTTRGNLRANSNNTYDRAELDRWAEKYRRASKRPMPSNGNEAPQTVGEAKDAADLRYKLARAEREELVTAQLKGTLLEKGDVEAALSELIMTTKRAFLLLPHQAPTLLAGKDAVGQMEALQSMVDEIITGLSEQATLQQIERRLK